MGSISSLDNFTAFAQNEKSVSDSTYCHAIILTEQLETSCTKYALYSIILLCLCTINKHLEIILKKRGPQKYKYYDNICVLVEYYFF